jgi:hypothetical protein
MRFATAAIASLLLAGASAPALSQTASTSVPLIERVTYVVFPDEGHGFARPQNNIAFNAVAEQFLAGCLGGRAEPYGDALRASTMKVEAEAPFTPGLRTALEAK